MVRYYKLEHKNGLESCFFANLALALVVRVDLFRIECFETAYLFTFAAVELADFIEIVWLN